MHLLQLTVQVLLVHVKVVTSKDVAICARVNTEQIYTVLTCLTMSDNLLVPSHVCRDELHVLGCLLVADLGDVGRISVTESRNLTMEQVFQGRFRPRHIRILVGMDI